MLLVLFGVSPLCVFFYFGPLWYLSFVMLNLCGVSPFVVLVICGVNPFVTMFQCDVNPF